MAETQDTQVLLRQARETIAKQQEMLKELTADPWKLGSVVAVLKDTIVVDAGGRFELPKTKVAVKAGDIVRVAPTGGIIAVSPYVTYGASGTVVSRDNNVMRVQCDQELLTITESRVADVDIGDEVVLDGANASVVLKLKRKAQQVLKHETGVGWDDIGGLDEAKRVLRESVEMPYTHAELFAFFGKKPAKGVLLFGLPGNGKTMLGKATATALAKAHGGEAAKGGFLYIKGPELLSKWVGETEQSIRLLFSHARDHYAKHGYPAVIFIDEADAVLGARGAYHASGLEHTVVPQFLSEMDGLDDSKAIVLLATNRADQLDSAVIRAGRVDRKVRVGAPDRVAAQQVLTIHMSPVPLAPGAAVSQLTEMVVKVLWSNIFPLYHLRVGGASEMVFHLSDALSGAVLAGVIEQGEAKAIHRNVEVKARKPLGLCMDDLAAAVDDIYREHCGMQHRLEIEDFAEQHRVKVSGVTKLPYRAQEVKA